MFERYLVRTLNLHQLDCMNVVEGEYFNPVPVGDEKFDHVLLGDLVVVVFVYHREYEGDYSLLGVQAKHSHCWEPFDKRYFINAFLFDQLEEAVNVGGE